MNRVIKICNDKFERMKEHTLLAAFLKYPPANHPHSHNPSLSKHTHPTAPTALLYCPRGLDTRHRQGSTVASATTASHAACMCSRMQKGVRDKD